MGLLNGTATFTRFRVDGPPQGMFRREQLDALSENDIEQCKMIASDGIQVGWTAGEHISDRNFTFEKNVLEDALYFQLCIEIQAWPVEKLKSYYAIELAGLAKNNPSGHPSSLNKREAKEAARDRLEQEAKDGRFRRRKLIDVLWDRRSGEVFFGSTSQAHAVKMAVLFKNTFGHELKAITAGSLCQEFSTADDEFDPGAIELAGLSPFIPSLTPFEACWDPVRESRDFIGNEFLLWLWYQCDDESETIQLPDNSNATIFLSKTLTLECPRGSSGREVFTHDGPTRLPEAFRAIRGGKLPRRCGITFVRHDYQYELVFSPETWAVGSAKIPKPRDECDTTHARLCDRVEMLRHMIDGIDLLYRAFCRERFSEAWTTTLPKLQRWLERETVRG